MARKKKQLPVLEKVTITDVAAEGKAIARVNDMVVFVPYVAPGDVVDIQLTRKKHSYAEGKAIFFHEQATQRAVPFCEHFGVCGGCKWQHLPYEEQSSWHGRSEQPAGNIHYGYHSTASCSHCNSGSPQSESG